MAGVDEDDGFKYLDQVVANPPVAETKKRRLWLGYSAEHLRNKNFKDHSKDHNPQQQTATSKATLSSARNGEENYDEPNDYGNLDELATTLPEDEHEDQKQGYFEDRKVEADEGRISREDGRQRVSRKATELYTISYLIFFSILGTLARLGLQALTVYPGAPVQTSVLWANFGGSLIMGFLSEDRKLFREEWGTAEAREPARDEEQANRPNRSPSADKSHGAVKKTVPLYIGLATGFCGSFTSFSSFMRDAFLALANALPVPVSHPSSAPISTTLNVHRNPGYSFMAVLAVLITTVGLCLGALQFGAHLALALEPITPSIPFLFARKLVDRFFVFLAWGSWLGAIIMTLFPPDRPNGPLGQMSWAQERWRTEALFALVLAPLGCLLRFYASIHLNGRIKAFPLGTFAVNILGSAMLAMFVDLQRAPVGGIVGCQVLQGMTDGFCGCLTTVSTWVAELKSLRRRHAYVYGITSIGSGLALMVVIVGSLMWTEGFGHSTCVA